MCHMRRLHLERPLRIELGILCLLLSHVAGCSCNSTSTGNADSWQHFADGGLFVTATPSPVADGSAIVYASPCSGHGDIYLVKENGNSSIRLTSSDDFETSPVVTPDGKRVIFARESEGSRHLWLINIDGTSARALTTGKCIDEPSTLSADGRYFLFTRAPSSGQGGTTVRTFVMALDDATDAVDVGDVAIWSADENAVVCADGGEIWYHVVDPSRRGERRKINASGWPLDISSDGRWLITARRSPSDTWTGDEQLWLTDLNSASESQFATGHSAVFVGQKRDRIFYIAGTGQTPFVYMLETAVAHRIEAPGTYKTHPRILFDGTGVVVGSFDRNQNAECNLLFLDCELFEATFIARLSCISPEFRPFPRLK